MKTWFALVALAFAAGASFGYSFAHKSSADWRTLYEGCRVESELCRSYYRNRPQPLDDNHP